MSINRVKGLTCRGKLMLVGVGKKRGVAVGAGSPVGVT